MAKKKDKRSPSPGRSMIVLGMLLTKKAATFRHKADRRAKDARRVRFDRDE